MVAKRIVLCLALCLFAATPAEAKLSLKNWHPGLPNPLTLSGNSPSIVAGYFMGLPWCGATATMLATVVLNRELTPREAFSIMGSCVLPVVGGMIVNHFWNPKWDKLYKKPANTSYLP